MIKKIRKITAWNWKNNTEGEWNKEAFI